MLSTAGSSICARSIPGKSPHATLNGRFHNCSTWTETGSVIPNALCIAARVSYATSSAFSRSDQVSARTTVHRAADRSGPHSNRENAVPNHFEYGAYCRSIRNAQSHQIRNEPRADQRRSQFVAHGSGPAHQVDLRVDAPPTGHQQVEPDVARVVGEAVADRLQADAVVIDLAGGEHPQPMLREGEPVAGVQLAIHVHSQVMQEITTNRVGLAVDRTVPKARWQPSPQRVADVRAEERGVRPPKEEENAWLPVVVG